MGAIPPQSWFLASNRSFKSSRGERRTSSPTRLIAVANSSLNVGESLRLRCSHLLLCLHRQESYHSDILPSINDIWCQRSYSQKRYSLLQILADTYSSYSCFSFFNGSDFGKDIVDKNGIRYKTSKGNSGRIWSNAILALNILVYVAQFATQGKLTLWGAKVNSLIDKGQLWRLATSSLLHANIGHLMVNCYSLNSIGPAVEQLSGPRRFLAIYFASTIASSLMSYRFCEAPAVGASGAIFGLCVIFPENSYKVLHENGLPSMKLVTYLSRQANKEEVGSYAVFVLRHRNLLGGGKQDLQEIARVIGLNMAIGLMSRGIDNWGHLGGLLGGAAMSWFLGPAWKYESRRVGGGSVFVDRAPIFQFVNRKTS